ncbi:MAG: hypothetical protein RLZZ230_472 [Candidatus Parcubacteria bacterium]
MRTKESKTTKITATKEDYVRAIYILNLTQEATGVTDISNKLKLSKSTVSERVKELVNEGWVVSEVYGKVSLTEQGINEGMKLTFKHRIIEYFLYNVLDVSKDSLHEEAERLEHAFSDEIIQKLAKFLANPEFDPHGSPIPKNVNWNLSKNNLNKTN